VQRWKTIAFSGVAVAAVIGYGATHRQSFGLGGARPVSAPSLDLADAAPPTGRPASITWQKVDRPADGFRVEMPTNVSQIQIPAYNENSSAAPVNMIFSNPDAATTFSVSWADHPPVAHASGSSPGKILEAARDGAVARTQTSIVSQDEFNIQGFPGREFSSRNSAGGVLNARLLYAGSRLYMLSAAFSSPGARRDRDVTRFFNSFIVTSASGTRRSGS
jgi:hypothetical protein